MGDLYVINSSTPAAGSRIASGVASISDQGIDNWGQPVIDIVLDNGNAEEYHDFLPLNGTTNPLVAGSPNYFPFTPLGPNVAQAKAGQGVSYVLLTNGQLGEYVDPNYATHYGYSSNPTPTGTSLGVIATGVTAIDVGTDAFGGNSVDYTTVASGVTTLHQWRNASASLSTLASGVTSFSAGQYGTHGYVDGSGNASVFSEATGRTTFLAPGVQSVVVGVDASGGYLAQLLYANGAADSYDAATNAFTHLNGGAPAFSPSARRSTGCSAFFSRTTRLPRVQTRLRSSAALRASHDGDFKVVIRPAKTSPPAPSPRGGEVFAATAPNLESTDERPVGDAAMRRGRGVSRKARMAPLPRVIIGGGVNASEVWRCSRGWRWRRAGCRMTSWSATGWRRVYEPGRRAGVSSSCYATATACCRCGSTAGSR